MADDAKNKLGPQLREFMYQLAQFAARTNKTGGAPTGAPEPEGMPCVPPEVHVLVRFSGDPADLRSAGLQNVAVFDNPHDGIKIAGGDIATARLDELAAIVHVISISASPEYHPALNFSVADIGALAVHAGGHGITGRDVVIAVIDTGIDWRHGAFRTPGGSTRIRAILDLSLTPQPASGSHPAEVGWSLGGPPLGVIYDRQWIDLAFQGMRRIRTVDVGASSGSVGHGTHVAGIAAGNGSPRDCFAWSSHTYVGVAPEAEIVAVRLGKDVRLDRALDFIRGFVTDKPLVVNFSFGRNSGPHDGTADDERLIDNFVAVPAGFPTRVMVVSAGNSGADKRHIRALVPGGMAGQLEIALRVNNDDVENRFVDLWYSAGEQLDLEVVGPDATSSGVVLHGNSGRVTVNRGRSDQTNVTVRGTAVDPNNGDPNFLIALTKVVAAKGALASGGWVLRLFNRGNADVEVHGWISGSGGDLVPPIFPAGSTSETTITTPATAHGAIAVANYEARRNWSDCCPSGAVVDSSGRGPARKVTAAVPNPKPTIAAPGESITSANADAGNLRGNIFDFCPDVCCFLYVSKSGTSMAAPHVAGAVALMLSLDPTMTREDIVRYLSDTARPAPAGERDLYGAGKLDVRAAIDLIRLLRVGNAQPLARSATESLPARGAMAQRDLLARESRVTADALAARTPLPSAIAGLRARVSALQGGDLFLALVSKHFSEARRLINSNRRVATMWHRAEGPAMLRRLLGADPQSVAPIARAEQHDYVQRFFAMLNRYGSKQLQASLAAHQPMLVRILEDLPAVRITAHT